LALVLVLVAGAHAGCSTTLDPVGTKIGTTAGTIGGQTEACALGEAAQVVYWRVRSPAETADAGNGSAFYSGAGDNVYLEASMVVPSSGDHEFLEPGSAVIRCPVVLALAGRYHVWVRAYARTTGDNSMHVGIDDLWPDTSRALEVCKSSGGFDRWTWTSSQYVENAADTCQGPTAITVDVATPGAHTLMFSAREDEFRFDAWVMTLDGLFDPNQAAAP
jgi:hypothetical protein